MFKEQRLLDMRVKRAELQARINHLTLELPEGRSLTDKGCNNLETYKVEIAKLDILIDDLEHHLDEKVRLKLGVKHGKTANHRS